MMTSHQTNKQTGRHFSARSARAFAAALVLLLLAAVLIACQTPTQSDDEATTSTTEPVVIGASLPLTGRFSESGTAVQQGYEVWAALVNEAGGLLGRQVELIILDNGSDEDTAVADYEKLITEDKVDLVIGPFSSVLDIPTSEVAAKYGYAFVEPAGGAPDVFNRGLTNLFFAQPAQSARQADPFALYLLGLPAEQRPQTFAVIGQDDPFTRGVMNRLKELLADGGMDMMLETIYPPDTTDFSEIAEQVAALDPDLILGGTQLGDSIDQIKAYRAVAYQPRFAYFTNGPTLPGQFRGELGAATEGIFSSVSWFPEAREYQNTEFVTAYVEMFGGSLGDVPEDAANAFAVGQILQQGIENIGAIDNARLIEELHRGSYNTVIGLMSFDDTGAPEGSYLLLQWQGDNFVIVGPQDRAEVDPLAPPKPEW
ncbi:MAG: amino acid ABC transporter substrate-binding protein [Anaerolineales bacterium]|nr:amino acid ABC transporter substrate-binding protein [Anaerolineales bacterium]